MADDLTDSEKVNIAVGLLKDAPPGQVKMVLNDIRVLLGEDRPEVFSKLMDYDQENFTPASYDDGKVCLMSRYNNVSDSNTYLDPKHKTAFQYDHQKQSAVRVDSSQYKEMPMKSLREAMAAAAETYVVEHYPDGYFNVYSDDDNNVYLLIEDHKYSFNNFWTGAWKSEWKITQGSDGFDLCGVAKVRVHYYEDGNVQLNINKENTSTIESGSVENVAKLALRQVTDRENAFQKEVLDTMNKMSSASFKALRRALPVTRTKIDWDKIVAYKVGKELNQQ